MVGEVATQQLNGPAVSGGVPHHLGTEADVQHAVLGHQRVWRHTGDRSVCSAGSTAGLSSNRGPVSVLSWVNSWSVVTEVNSWSVVTEVNSWSVVTQGTGQCAQLGQQLVCRHTGDRSARSPAGLSSQSWVTSWSVVTELGYQLVCRHRVGLPAGLSSQSWVTSWSVVTELGHQLVCRHRVGSPAGLSSQRGPVSVLSWVNSWSVVTVRSAAGLLSQSWVTSWSVVTELGHQLVCRHRVGSPAGLSSQRASVSH